MACVGAQGRHVQVMQLFAQAHAPTPPHTPPHAHLPALSIPTLTCRFPLTLLTHKHSRATPVVADMRLVWVHGGAEPKVLRMRKHGRRLQVRLGGGEQAGVCQWHLNLLLSTARNHIHKKVRQSHQHGLPRPLPRPSACPHSKRPGLEAAAHMDHTSGSRGLRVAVNSSCNHTTYVLPWQPLPKHRCSLPTLIRMLSGLMSVAEQTYGAVRG